MISLVQKKINAKQIVTSKQITYTKMINDSSTAWRIKAKNIISTYYHSTLAALTQIFIICTKCWNFQKIKNNFFVESSKLINLFSTHAWKLHPLVLWELSFKAFDMRVIYKWGHHRSKWVYRSAYLLKECSNWKETIV